MKSFARKFLLVLFVTELVWAALLAFAPSSGQMRLFFVDEHGWFCDYRMPRGCADSERTYVPDETFRSDACYPLVFLVTAMLVAPLRTDNSRIEAKRAQEMVSRWLITGRPRKAAAGSPAQMLFHRDFGVYPRQSQKKWDKGGFAARG